jgi:peptidoglycan/xylan/chitin deacetylase (PgdA/CDA1 family)
VDGIDDRRAVHPCHGRSGLMAKACVILGLAAICATFSFAFVSPPASWIAGTTTLVATTALFTWAMCRVNSGFWIETLWQSRRLSRAVALTFDDGPDASFTPRVLDILAEKQVPATFFVVGERAERYPELIRRAHDMGHVIGNHSHTHTLRFHFLHGRGLRREIGACNEAIRSAIGLEPRLFRSPQGLKTPALGDVLRERGMAAIGWQVRGMDYLFRDPERIARRIVEGAVDGGVLLLHDGGGLQGSMDRSATIRALPLVIDGLRARGFTFLRVDQLFGVAAYRSECAGREPRGPVGRLARLETRPGALG